MEVDEIIIFRGHSVNDVHEFIEDVKHWKEEDQIKTLIALTDDEIYEFLKYCSRERASIWIQEGVFDTELIEFEAQRFVIHLKQQKGKDNG